MSEANITINGKPVTEEMSITIRVAIEHLATGLAEYGLGDDEHAKAMTKQYLARISEIRAIMERDL